jgi:cation transport ATPase
MSLKARRELLASTAVRYPKTSKKEKQTILDEFTASLTPLTLIALFLVGLVWKIVAVSWNEYSC